MYSVYLPQRLRQKEEQASSDQLGLVFFTDRIIAVSGAVKESVVRYDHIRPEKIQVLYNGIDLSVQVILRAMGSSLGIKPEEVVIGVIARLEEQKGHRVLLEALLTYSRFSDQP